MDLDTSDLKVSFDQEHLNGLENLVQGLIEEANFVRIHDLEAKINQINEAFRTVVTNELKLVDHCAALRALNESNKSKLEHAIRLAEIDRKTREDLLEETEKAWKQTTTARNKEKQTREANNSLKLEIANLSKLIEQGAGVTMGQEYDVREKMKEIETLNSMLEQSASVIEELKKSLAKCETDKCELTNLVKEKESRAVQLHQELTSAHLSVQKEKRIVDKLTEEVATLKRVCENKDNGIGQLNRTAQDLKDQIAALKASVREHKIDLDQTKNELNFQIARYRKLEQDLDQQLEKYDTLVSDFSQQSRTLVQKEHQIEKLNSELSLSQRAREDLACQLKQLELSKAQAVEESVRAAQSIKELNEQLELLESQKSKDRGQLLSVKDELDESIAEGKKLEHSNKALSAVIKTLKGDLKKTKANSSYLEALHSKLTKTIAGFDKERASFGSDLRDLGMRVNQLMDEIKLKELQVIDTKRMLKEMSAKYDVLKSLYQSVRTDRNTYSKKSIESQKVINELSKEITALRDQIKADNSLINYKNTELDRLVNEASKSKVQTESLKTMVDKEKLNLSQVEATIKRQESTEANLLKLISTQDQRIEQLKRQHETDLIRVQVLGTQLVRRNDEVYLLYQKIRLLEQVNQRDCQAYQHCLSELSKSIKQVKQLESAKKSWSSGQQTINVLENVIFRQAKKLRMERAKVEIVEDLKTKLNIHRWRQLQGSDPATYDLIAKVNTLQRSLIAKTKMVTLMELRLQEKDRMFVEVKKGLARRLVNDEQVCAVQVYKRTIRSMSDRLKAALAERNMLCDQLKAASNNNSSK